MTAREECVESFWESEAVWSIFVGADDSVRWNSLHFRSSVQSLIIKRTIDFSDPHHVRLKQVTFRTISQRTQTILINPSDERAATNCCQSKCAALRSTSAAYPINYSNWMEMYSRCSLSLDNSEFASKMTSTCFHSLIETKQICFINLRWSGSTYDAFLRTLFPFSTSREYFITSAKLNCASSIPHESRRQIKFSLSHTSCVIQLLINRCCWFQAESRSLNLARK